MDTSNEFNFLVCKAVLIPYRSGEEANVEGTPGSEFLPQVICRGALSCSCHCFVVKKVTMAQGPLTPLTTFAKYNPHFPPSSSFSDAGVD